MTRRAGTLWSARAAKLWCSSPRLSRLVRVHERVTKRVGERASAACARTRTWGDVYSNAPHVPTRARICSDLLFHVGPGAHRPCLSLLFVVHLYNCFLIIACDLSWLIACCSFICLSFFLIFFLFYFLLFFIFSFLFYSYLHVFIFNSPFYCHHPSSRPSRARWPT